MLVVQSKRLADIIQKYEHTELGWVVADLVQQDRCGEVCETSNSEDLAFFPSVPPYAS